MRVIYKGIDFTAMVDAALEAREERRRTTAQPAPIPAVPKQRGKLTSIEVEQIRFIRQERQWSYRELARAFGVDRGTIKYRLRDQGMERAS